MPLSVNGAASSQCMAALRRGTMGSMAEETDRYITVPNLAAVADVRIPDGAKVTHEYAIRDRTTGLYMYRCYGYRPDGTPHARFQTKPRKWTDLRVLRSYLRPLDGKYPASWEVRIFEVRTHEVASVSVLELHRQPTEPFHTDGGTV